MITPWWLFIINFVFLGWVFWDELSDDFTWKDLYVAVMWFISYNFLVGAFVFGGVLKALSEALKLCGG